MKLTDLTCLSPETRAKTLVGLYLQSWATMEWSLNDAIEHAFRLSPLEGVILTRNVQFRDKIHILKTIIDLRIVDPTRSAELKGTLDKIANLSPDRNMVAHDMFAPSDDGEGIKFYVVKAKGTISIPKATWSMLTVLEKSNELCEFTEAINRIRDEIPDLTLMEQLRRLKEASKSGEPVNLLHLYRQPQSPPDSPRPQPTPQTDSETPPKTEA